MEIILNNRSETFEADSLTVAELLERKNFTFKMLVIKVNDVLVKNDAYHTQTIMDGDHVMVLHLISGG
ncbi:MAG TPA: sulfur carrier protein ThiS [Bacteroidales bacterium]|nr:sulfur carrier protein ThiS [Bacteroidales bacterium]HSA43173.1 sulfur carrier protein ThiS [Bacteroidales bacterium]